MNRTRLKWHPTPFHAEDLDELVALSQLQPGKAATVTPAYIHWQNHGNPAGLATAVLAKEDGSNKIIGQIWMIPLRIQVGGVVRMGSMACYALVHPDYQRQGVFTQLMPFCYEMASQTGVEFCYGIPNPKTFAVKVGRLNWSHIGNAGLYLRLLNTRRLVRRRLGDGLIPRTLASASQMAGGLIFQPRQFSPALAEFDIRTLSGDEPSLDQFWERIKGKYTVMVVRDSRFLRWRYHQVPDRDYVMLAACQDGSIRAYAVLRCVTIRGLACGMIVDFLVEPNPAGSTAGEALLQHAVEHFKERRMDLTGCLMLPGAEEARLLRNQAYLLCPSRLLPQPLPIILRTNDGIEDQDLLYEARGWFLTMGDWDAV